MKSLLLLLLVIPSLSHAFSVDSSGYYFKQALQLKEEKKPLDADRYFQKAIYHNAADASLRVQYAGFLVNQRKYRQAEKELVTANQQMPANNEVLQKLAEVSFLLHNWEQVVAYGNALLSQHSVPGVRLLVGKAYNELEEYGLADATLQKAIEEDPANVDAIVLYGKVLVELSRYKDAIAVYEKALALQPGNALLLYECALLQVTSGNDKKGVVYFKMAADHGYKPDLNYKQNLGFAYLSFDIEEGVKLLMEVLQKKPKDEEIMWAIADAYYRKKNYQVAVIHFHKLYEADRSNAKALYMTGIVYQRMGEKARGGAICQQALEMDPRLSEYVKMVFGR